MHDLFCGKNNWKQSAVKMGNRKMKRSEKNKVEKFELKENFRHRGVIKRLDTVDRVRNEEEQRERLRIIQHLQNFSVISDTHV